VGADQIGDLLQNGAAFLPGGGAPGGVSGAGGGDGVLHVLARAALEVADDDIGVDRAAGLKRGAAGALLGPDELGVCLAEFGAQAIHRPLELEMQLFVVGGQGCVGDFQLGHTAPLLEYRRDLRAMRR